MKKIFLLVLCFFITEIINAQPVAGFEKSTSNVCQNSYVHYRDASTGALFYYWDFGNGVTKTGSGPYSISYSTPGTYNVVQVVSDGVLNSTMTSSITVTASAAATPTLSYDSPICMYTYNGGYGNPLSPIISSTTSGGTFSTFLEPSLEAYINTTTGVVTTARIIPAGTYPIFYSYNTGSCVVASNSFSTVLNNVYPDNITDATVNFLCNTLVLNSGANAIGAIQWQYSVAGTGWLNYTGANLTSVITPVLTTSHNFRALLFGPGCTPQATNTIYYPVDGVSTAGNVSITNQIICLNTQTTMTLSGFFGKVRWQKSLNGTLWTDETSTGSFFNFSVGGPNVTTYTPPALTTPQLTYYRAAVTYVQSGTNCSTVLSNVVTVSSEFCTVTSAINSTTVSPICQTVPRSTFVFSDASFASGSSVSTITSWRWGFSSGSPAISTNQNPPVVSFTGFGTRTISLTVTGPGGIRSISQQVITIDGLSTFTGYLPGLFQTVCGNNQASVTVTSSNTNPSIQWQQSFDNLSFVDIPGEINRTLVTPPITILGYFRTTIKNGVCPAVTTPGHRIEPTAPLGIIDVSPPYQTVCYGGKYNLSVVGQNGFVRWQSTTDTFLGWNDISGASGNIYNPISLTGTTIFRAVIGDLLGGLCNTIPSGNFTISVVSCPILSTITGASNYLSDRACVSNAFFNFTENTPTISGVQFVKWEWTVDNGGIPSSINKFSPGVSALTTITSVGIRTISLVVTGVINNYTYTGSTFYNVTVDGLSTITGLTANTVNGDGCKEATFSLTASSTNTYEIYQWYQFLSPNWQIPVGGSGSNTLIYNSPPLISTTSYLITSKNGLCSVYTSSGITINILPDLVINPTNNITLNVCSGNGTNMSVSGLNGTINWQEYSISGSTWVNANGIDNGTGGFITPYLLQTTQYRASITDPLGCFTSVSGIFTISVVSCPIIANYTTSSPFIPGRTCLSQPRLNFYNNTNTIAGVQFIKWDWDFGPTAIPSTFTATSLGLNPPLINFSIAGIFPVSITVTGVSGIVTFTGSFTANITIDGIPTVVGLAATNKELCAGQNSLISFNNSFPASGTPDINWYISTTGGATWIQDFGNNSNIYSNRPYYTTTEVIVTASNGICPVFTTPSIVITVTSQPVIYSFSYPVAAACETQITSISPVVSTNGYSGTFGSNKPTILLQPTTGIINPLGSAADNYIITYSLPGIGGCSPAGASTSMIIGNRPNIPNFTYGYGAYCNNSGSISPTAFGAFPPGSFATTTVGIPLNTTSGILNLTTTVPGGVYAITFYSDPVNGCLQESKSSVITISGLPETPKFGYDNFFYCNGIGLIPMPTSTGIAPGDGGSWTIFPNNNISINTTGSVNVSSLTGRGSYTVYYTKPANGGCLNPVSNFAIFFVDQLPLTPNFNYGINPQYCTNVNIPLPNRISGVSGGAFYSTSADITVDPTSGEVTPKSFNISNGPRIIEYRINAGLVCPSVVGQALITFIGLPNPELTIPKTIFCNNEINAMLTVTGNPAGGSFYVTSTNGSNVAIPGSIMSISGTANPQVGQLNFNSNTPQQIYFARYIANVSSGCAVSTVPSNFVQFYIQDDPPTPIFDYGFNLLCENNKILPINKVDSTFANASYSCDSAKISFLSNGSAFLNSVANGIYIITVTNLALVPSGVTTGTSQCLNKSSTATITVNGNLGNTVPSINYDKLLSGYCSTDGFAYPTVTLTGGTYYTYTPGILLDPITGIITISSSISIPILSFSVNYKKNRSVGCPPDTSNSPANINIYRSYQPPFISYTYPEFCQSENDPVANGSFDLKGAFNSNPIGLVFVSSLLGKIDMKKSAPGSYTVIYRTPSINDVPCPVLTASTNLTIYKVPDKPSISYAGPYCNDIVPLISLTSRINLSTNGYFIASPGLQINTLTGEINVNNVSGGTYSVQYVNPPNGICNAVVSDKSDIVINQKPETPIVDYSKEIQCNTGTLLPNQGSILTQGGYFKSATSLVLDSLTGEIDLQRSIPGKYIINYIVPASKGCAIQYDTSTVSIVSPKVGLVELVNKIGEICGGQSVDIRISDYNGKIRWQEKRSSTGLWSNSQGTFSDSTLIFKTYPLTENVKFRAVVNVSLCPNEAYSDSVFLRVVPESKGGVAIADTNLICYKLNTQIRLFDSKGSIQWQFSRDSLFGFADLLENQTVRDSVLSTPNQNEYGSILYYRAKVTSGTCSEDFSNIVGIRVCQTGNFIPNALTPESVGSNSNWTLFQLNLRDYAEIKIFNIHGIVVASFNGTYFNRDEFAGWDGGNLPAATYWYLIDRKDGSKPITGSITVLK
ncbi:MAG: gliding motility-associated C-terminal domain-containing protein [Bacteroidota bacterium]|nr:gliding motility-associated C-terminal domain-containing protein [Bacteroidota bacterium]